MGRLKSLDVRVLHYDVGKISTTVTLKKNQFLLTQLEKEKTTAITITNLATVQKISFCCLLVWKLKLNN